MSQMEVTLTPFELDRRTQALTIADEDWRLVTRLFARRGFCPDISAGLDRPNCRTVAQHLRRVIDSGEVAGPEARVLRVLLDFLTGSGAGGFFALRGWRRATPAESRGRRERTR